MFISGANLGLIPIHARNREDEEEEKRLFFVGIKAKDFLEISYHTNPMNMVFMECRVLILDLYPGRSLKG